MSPQYNNLATAVDDSSLYYSSCCHTFHNDQLTTFNYSPRSPDRVCRECALPLPGPLWDTQLGKYERFRAGCAAMRATFETITKDFEAEQDVPVDPRLEKIWYRQYPRDKFWNAGVERAMLQREKESKIEIAASIERQAAIKDMKKQREIFTGRGTGTRGGYRGNRGNYGGNRGGGGAGKWTEGGSGWGPRKVL